MVIAALELDLEHAQGHAHDQSNHEQDDCAQRHDADPHLALLAAPGLGYRTKLVRPVL